MSRAVDSTARAMAGEALSRLDNGGSGSGGTTVDAYSKLETDNLLNAKVDDVEFTPIKALAESNEINITYLANNKAEKTEVNALSELVADIDSEVDLKANASDVYTKTETNTAISDKVAEIVANAPEDFDTLKEMSDWIDSHEESASAMNTAIKQNTSDIANLKVTDKTTATEIVSIKNNVAINRTALGIECKNLLNESEFIASITAVTRGTLTKNTDNFTVSATDNDAYTYPNTNDNAYKIPVKPKTTYKLSWNSNNTLDGTIYVFFNGVNTTGSYAWINNATSKSLTFTTKADTTHITMRLGVMYSGNAITYSNLMLRYADIVDDTYEPYQPSLQEQVTALTARIEALETALASQEA